MGLISRVSSRTYSPKMDLLRSERILDQLKLLGYDKKFLPKYRAVGIRSISRHYFAIEKKPKESTVPQFYGYACVGYWLCELCGRSMDIPNETDDPMDTLSNLLQEAMSIGVKNLGFQAVSLRHGFGDEAMVLIEGLLQHALAVKNFEFKKPEYPEVDDVDGNEPSRSGTAMSQASDSIADEVETRKKNKRVPFFMLDESSGSESENDENQDLDYLLNRDSTNNALRQTKKMASTYEDWMEEIDRVAPNLKAVARVETKDWRARLDQISLHQSNIDKILETTKPKLQRLDKDLGKTIDTVESRQKYINNQLSTLLSNDLRKAQDRLADLEQKFEHSNQGVSKGQDTLNALNVQIETVKRQMEDRGTSMTDGTPLVRLKQALQRLESEINEMTLQNAVLEHQLTQMRMHKKSTLARDVNLNQNSVMA